jgi:acyl-CoA reductase-like NAD-dependent aldehyde dehydrogenase
VVWLRGFRLRLFDAMDRFCELIGEEIGKPEHEVVTGDLLPLLASCKWYERHARRLLRPRRPLGQPIWMLGQRHRVIRQPLGHVGIIATWNYPAQLLGIQLVQALIAGNRVTVKPSERSPRTQALLLELAAQGLPEGTLQTLPATREAGEQMLGQHRFDHVVFTGSTEVGRAIAQSLARSLTPSTLELSGRDTVFVLDDADVELAAERIWNLVEMNCGQTCMAPRRVLADASIFDHLTEALRAITPESSRAMIDEQASRRVSVLASEAEQSGAELIPPLDGDDAQRVAARIVIGADPDAEVVAGDHFGPLCAVVRCATEDEMLRIHRDCTQHLATSVFTASRSRLESLARRIASSTIVHNDVVLPTAHPGVSIQGHHDSGWGASRGEAGLLAMTRAVHLSSVPKRLRAPAGTPTPKQLDQLRRGLKWLYGRGRRP